jgi:hypothetical protein
MAQRNGGALRRMLLSADCLSDSAIFLGSVQVKTPSSRSNALLSLVTLPDQRVLCDDLDFVDINCALSEAKSVYMYADKMPYFTRIKADVYPSMGGQLRAARPI